MLGSSDRLMSNQAPPRTRTQKTRNSTAFRIPRATSAFGYGKRGQSGEMGHGTESTAQDVGFKYGTWDPKHANRNLNLQSHHDTPIRCYELRTKPSQV